METGFSKNRKLRTISGSRKKFIKCEDGDLLKGELEHLKSILNLAHPLKVIWLPNKGRGLSGEVIGDKIYIYEEDMDKAIQTLRREVIDYLLSKKLVEPLIEMINALIKTHEKRIYIEKEKIVDSLLNLFES